jgi:hypothetical protein
VWCGLAPLLARGFCSVRGRDWFLEIRSTLARGGMAQQFVRLGELELARQEIIARRSAQARCPACRGDTKVCEAWRVRVLLGLVVLKASCASVFRRIAGKSARQPGVGRGIA